MPIDFTIDPAARLVVYIVEGTASREEAIEFIDTVIAHPEFQRGFNFLGDRRDVVHGPSSGYVYGVTEDINSRRNALSPCRWAVIVSNDYSYGMARMWGIMTERAKVEILSFRMAEEAAGWLGVSADHVPQRFVPRSKEIVHVGSSKV
jgi:hypothetical protein